MGRTKLPGEPGVTIIMASPKKRWGSALFRFDARRRLQRTFARCLVRGLAPLAQRVAREPVIVVLNHVSFWDGFLLPCLERALCADAYCLMDRANLERFSFLRFAGAIPLGCGDIRRAQADLEHAARLLDRPGRLLFMFPQGKQVPAQLPLRFHGGVLRMAELSGAAVVPVGLRYEFLEDPKPEIRISVGGAVSLLGTRVQRKRALESAVRVELDSIDASHLSAPTSTERAFVPLLQAKPRGLPVGTRWLALASARRSP